MYATMTTRTNNNCFCAETSQDTRALAMICWIAKYAVNTHDRMNYIHRQTHAIAHTLCSRVYIDTAHMRQRQQEGEGIERQDEKMCEFQDRATVFILLNVHIILTLDRCIKSMYALLLRNDSCLLTLQH